MDSNANSKMAFDSLLIEKFLDIFKILQEKKYKYFYVLTMVRLDLLIPDRIKNDLI